MMIFSARSYNQRFTVLNTHQCLTTVQMRYHSYAREGFGDAVMAKCGHKNAQTPYLPTGTPPDPREEDGADEDDGWVMSYVYQPERDKSEVLILNGQDIAGEPAAVIELPVRVPAGFHGNWVSDED